MTGGETLHGTVRPPGAKNSALKLIAASLLTDERVVLKDVPGISDVPVMSQLVESVGAATETDCQIPGRITLHAAGPIGWQPDRDLMAAIRASTAMLGALVGRTGRARLVSPGGDRIGKRAIDLHLSGLQELGARVEYGDGFIDVIAPRLQGARITLEYASVGATENLIMAATCASGVTVIDNAAREPEIQDLCQMLVAMGARIDGIGTSTVTVTGVEQLHGVTWSVVPDRIAAGTWMVAGAVTGGEVTVDNIRPDHHDMLFRVLERAGVGLDIGPRHVTVTGGSLRATRILTLPYPGLATDLMPQLLVLLSCAAGVSQCTENVFESRYAFVSELQRLGADITVEGHHAVVRGPAHLVGTHIDSLDIRAGAAGVIAGLVAEGTTVVHDIHHIDRGYTDFAQNLANLGAQIARLPADQAPEPSRP